MAQEQNPIPVPASGLLLDVERIPSAADRGKAGAAMDNDGNDPSEM